MLKSTAAAEVWDAGVLTAPALPLGSGAASLSRMLLRWRWEWLSLLLLLLLLLLLWASALVLVFLPRSLRPKYRPDPSHTHYLEDPRRRIGLKQCGQPSY